MAFIAGIPAIFALMVASSRGLPAAFLDVYLPVLFLLPDYYRWVLPALPDPTFNESAILPIGVLFLMRFGKTWKYSFMDVLICGFAIAMGCSEFLATGFADAQNLMFDMVGTVVFPYMLAKGLVEPFGLGVAFARRIVILLFWIAVVSVYEFRFGATPWQLALSRFFPGQGTGWVTTFRWGFARVAGPFGHAILAGLIIAIAYRLQRWLQWTGAWDSDPGFLSKLPLKKSAVITLGLMAGIVMTMVRGPWIGGIFGAIFPMIGRAKNRKLGIVLVLAAIFLVALPGAIALYSWASVGRENAKSDSQETAAYRKELIDKYVDIVKERPLWGWGTNGWPKVDGMASIDNYYLLLSLMHGLIASGLLVAIMIAMMVRLMAFGMKRPPPAVRGGSLAFTLAGVQMVVLITIATVFLGGPVVAIWSLITGWSEGYLINADRQQTQEVAATRAPASAVPFRFERVVV